MYAVADENKQIVAYYGNEDEAYLSDYVTSPKYLLYKVSLPEGVTIDDCRYIISANDKLHAIPKEWVLRKQYDELEEKYGMENARAAALILAISSSSLLQKIKYLFTGKLT